MLFAYVLTVTFFCHGLSKKDFRQENSWNYPHIKTERFINFSNIFLNKFVLDKVLVIFIIFFVVPVADLISISSHKICIYAFFFAVKIRGEHLNQGKKNSTKRNVQNKFMYRWWPPYFFFCY